MQLYNRLHGNRFQYNCIRNVKNKMKMKMQRKVEIYFYGLIYQYCVQYQHLECQEGGKPNYPVTTVA